MLALLGLALSYPSVRPEPVEGRPALEREGRPSTSSGQTGSEQARSPEPQTAVNAERAFAADAQRIGQWAAFRKWATADAIMFLPQPTKMQQATKSWPEPKEAVRWAPAASFVSCDGKVAANTGPSLNARGQHGYFSTIWVRQPDNGWKWTIDAGDDLAAPRWPLDVQPEVRRASCRRAPRRETFYVRDAIEGGASPDGSLRWEWLVAVDGARRFQVWLWDGSAFRSVIHDQVAAPAQ
jgi:hypothetical protein